MPQHFYCFTILVIFGLIPSWAFAFASKETHPVLTERAVEYTENFDNFLKIQLGIDEGVKGMLNNSTDTYSITEWLREGSIEEDDPACRAASHFHDPLRPWTESMLTDPLWIVDRWCDATTPFRQKYSNVSWATGFSDKDGHTMPHTVNGRSTPEKQNGRNWFVARALYYSALLEANAQKREAYFAETFRTLGYVLHLLEDMAVPAHTRNDFSEGHSKFIGCSKENGCWPVSWIGNPFEGYVRDNFDEIDDAISDISKPFTGEKKLTNFWDTDTHVSGTTPTNFIGQDLGLAEYSNANFVSYATIFKDESEPEHFFNFPNKESVSAQDYPDKIDLHLYETWAHDQKLDKGVYLTKNKHGEVINKFAKARYMFYGADWDTEARYDLKFTLDYQCYLEYATHLIPRAIGYSAGLLDYFFRGTLEISPPDQYVYAIIDGGEIDLVDNTQYLHTLKAKVRNNTQDEEMFAGLLYAVAKYKRIIGYQPDLSSGSPSAGMREAEFSYSVSEPIEISSLSSTTPEEFSFDFTNDPIPVGITDLYLNVVFRGTLGNESEQAIAVGMKDLNEPQHIATWNDTDYFQLNGVPVKADDIRRDQPLIAEVAHIDPHSFTETIGFSRHYPNVDSPPIVVITDLPPARYSRIIVVTDADDTSYFLTDKIIAFWHPDQPGVDAPSLDGTWRYSLPTAVHQEESDGAWESSPVYRVRDIIQHQSLYFINAYPEFIYINNLPAPPENALGPFPAAIDLSN